MKMRYAIGVGTIMMACLPLVASSEPTGDNGTAKPSATEFAPGFQCTSSRPCQNVTGEVLIIEESYLVREANGHEFRMKVTRETKMKELPKVGDTVAAQLTSDGKVQSIAKIAP